MKATRIAELKAKEELLKGQVKAEKEYALSKLSNCAYNLISVPCISKYLRGNISHGFREDEIWINMEFGFWDEEKNEVDFGSTYTVYYDTISDKVSLNFGVIGQFTVDNFCQVKRLYSLNYIAHIGDELADALREVVSIAREGFIGTEIELGEVRYEIRNIEAEIANEQKEAIINSVKLGMTVERTDVSGSKYCSIPNHSWVTDNLWKVTKITPKIIWLTNSHGAEVRVKKVDFAVCISTGVLVVK